MVSGNVICVHDALFTLKNRFASDAKSNDFTATLVLSCNIWPGRQQQFLSFESKVEFTKIY